MGVEVEVDEILDRLGRTVRRHFARSNESSEGLRHFDVDQMWRMELVLVSKETRLDPSAERRLGPALDHHVARQPNVQPLTIVRW